MLGIHFGLVLTYHIGHWMWWSSCLDILQRILYSRLRLLAFQCRYAFEHSHSCLKWI